ncbi:MAG: alternative ribosome rescue aminoacyl-tRNA hydrolase ArfB [Thermoanaerobaculia bacterium]|nr:alternative ribosome rescue aminoacyl-tRNA hydrolase ArfB [Thermoanaerobaculia bacterium]
MSRVPSIPESDLSFTTSRSSGPGGQNVNKLETRVTVELDLKESDALTPDEKERVRQKLSTRISGEDVLQVSSQRFRTQHRNRRDVVERLLGLITEALEEKPKRRKTKPPRRAERRRIEKKKKRGELKKLRKNPKGDV